MTQDQVSWSEGGEHPSGELMVVLSRQVFIFNPKAAHGQQHIRAPGCWKSGLLSLGHEEAAPTQLCPISVKSWDKMQIMWIDQGLEEDIMEQE